MYRESESSSTAVVASPEPSTEELVRFRFDSRFDAPFIIDSIESMTQLAKDPANAGRTYQVTREVFDHFEQKVRPYMEPNPPGVTSRINQLLGTDFQDNEKFGCVGVCECSHCGHKLTFADHIESALRMGIHTVEDFKRLFTDGNHYITVTAKQEREMLCPKCDTKTFFPRLCYDAGGSYTYAGEGGAHRQ
jgi:hypothetical protein